ncbi:transporter DMT superfamily protein [Glycocaulis alkaliphilus]|uniref:Transporter DMT superfamily protein n=1 Tax=Glycocaulis alkaliphilus TaxID=1434191 RepID=A0A3T0ED93_9PROT|nr:EamA family transporter RarD [Glycocaulis alkaliphilus]AZU05282.1 transporter DMT superfamily protein [Glycocaulis alkaliphilus]GGB81879.1 chloramphenicol resistance permease RarD [Glycocaulis alkaliphilus]
MATPADPSAAPVAPPPPDSGRLDAGRAGAAALSAYVIWGLSAAFYKFLGFASATEIVLHRAIWSVPLLALLVWMAGRAPSAWRLMLDRRAMATLLLSAILIASNWWVFVWAINADRVLDVSLGYFINPLMNVAVGVFIAGERFGRLRMIAVGLAVIGVINQVVAVGEIPWIGLFLAASFTAYGYIRKTIATDGRVGLFWETLIISLPSVVALFFLEVSGSGGSFLGSPSQALLLILTGPMTVAPLLLFIIGARGLHFATIGLLQFVAPTLQFAVGIIWGEIFTLAHAITFAFIWAGLAVFTFDLLSSRKRALKQSQS